MRAIYNGLDLMFTKVHEFSAEAVYDDTGTDYLYTRVTLFAETLVNGQAAIVDRPGPNGPYMSYTFSGGAPTNPAGPVRRVAPSPVAPLPTAVGIDFAPASTPLRGVALSPNPPALTHAVIRHRLSTPRGQLYIFEGAGMETKTPPAGSTDPPAATLLVQSPASGYGVDCKNGPTPRVLKVYEDFGGGQTFACTWAVQTFINEAQNNGSNPNGALLSNRYSQTHRVRDDSYTVIQTEGRAIFRTDFVYTGSSPGSGGVSPDAGRATLFMPIPQGFIREIDYVTAAPDAVGVDYGYTDTQVAVNFVAGPFCQAAHISAVHQQAIISDMNILKSAWGLFSEALGAKANLQIAKSSPERAARSGGAKKTPAPKSKRPPYGSFGAH